MDRGLLMWCTLLILSIALPYLVACESEPFEGRVRWACPYGRGADGIYSVEFQIEGVERVTFRDHANFTLNGIHNRCEKARLDGVVPGAWIRMSVCPDDLVEPGIPTLWRTVTVLEPPSSVE
ncbi:MAG: hypothetical protein HY340_03410 [Candidatus Kerfeldbacteria bacterium]|nr:hypothetical protein [Candidatus Kerfeldbacteria bacterium]